MTQTIESTSISATVTRKELLWMLTIASGVIKERSPKPALACVKLAAKDSSIDIFASDMEVCIKLSSDQCEIKSDGEICIPADKFRDVCSKESSDTLRISFDKEKAVIKGEESTLKLPTQPASDYPPSPAPDCENEFEISYGEIERMLGQSDWLIRTDDPRCLPGLLFSFDKRSFSIVGTDGHSLVICETPCKCDKPVSAVIPAKAIKILKSLGIDAEEVVSISIGENFAVFKTDSVVLTTNVLEGKFPAYQEIVPKSSSSEFSVSSDAAVQAIELASLATNEESKAVAIDFSDKGCSIYATSSTNGEADTTLSGKFIGEPFKIGVNPKFLVNGISNANQQDVKLEMNGYAKPIMIRGNGYTFLVSPVNLKSLEPK